MGNPAHTGGPHTLQNIPIREQKSGTHAAKERVPTSFMPEEKVKMMALCWCSLLRTYPCCLSRWLVVLSRNMLE
jgi:hypothetical protein